jgi:hypothetical protein
VLLDGPAEPSLLSSTRDLLDTDGRLEDERVPSLPLRLVQLLSDGRSDALDPELWGRA